jgi:nucleoside-diphosphate-sugar epimerase
MKKNILVTGGAGYIGSILVRLLLTEGFRVRVIDRLLFGGEAIVELMNNPDFEFMKGDVRNKNDLNAALLNIDFIVHLAAIVGDPACLKEPLLARETNFEATKNLYLLAQEYGVERFVFASTCSNYGKMKDPDFMVNENSELAPVSLYAETKVSVELFLLSQSKENKCKPTCLRFATAYGLSPRTRFDLTVNEFVKELSLGRELVVFGEQFWRPYCHVNDLASAILRTLTTDQDKIAFNVFNVGDTSENYTKKMIVDEILLQIPGSQIKYIQKSEDPRDYKVSFEKIKTLLDFHIKKKVPDGILEIRKVVTSGLLVNPDDQKYKNSN